MELVLHPYPTHGAPRTLEETATGKPDEGQAVGRGGPHTSLVPLPALPLAGCWLQKCGEGIQTHSSPEQPRQRAERSKLSQGLDFLMGLSVLC